MLFTERLTEISEEYFIMRGVIQTLMRFFGAVGINEAGKLSVAICAVFEMSLVVLHMPFMEYICMCLSIWYSPEILYKHMLKFIHYRIVFSGNLDVKRHLLS